MTMAPPFRPRQHESEEFFLICINFDSTCHDEHGKTNHITEGKKNSNTAHAGEGHHAESSRIMHGHGMHTPQAMHGAYLPLKYNCYVQLDLQFLLERSKHKPGTFILKFYKFIVHTNL